MDKAAKRKMKLRYLGNEVFFLGPALLFFSLTLLLSFVLSFYYAFTDWNGVASQINWVGLENFKKLLTDKTFWRSFTFTARYAVAIVILDNLIGFSFALMISSIRRFSNALRSALFIPYAMSGFVLGFIWRFIFTEGFPAIGAATGIPFFNLKWLATADTAYWGMVMMTVWKQAGYIMVVYIAGLTTIPSEIIEASSVDGANSRQQLFRIKIPLLMQSVTVCLFLSILWAFNVFDINLSLTKGGPYNSTLSMSLNIYNEAFKYLKNGYAVAKALVFFFIVAIIGIIQTKATSSREVEM